jgi:hypothetical protein
MATLFNRRLLSPADTMHPELALLSSPVHQAYRVLHAGFFILPLVAGLDKFFDRLCDWTMYLAPVFPDLLGVSKQTFMHGVGAIEIIASLLVATMPRIGAYVVMGWLWAIIINLLMVGRWYDVALRDFGLSLGAFALARLAWSHYRSHKPTRPAAAHP